MEMRNDSKDIKTVEQQQADETTVPGLEYIDTHFHIWDLDRFSYPWPTKDLRPLYRNVTLSEYNKEAKKSGVAGAIFVQVLNNSIEEAKWILSQCSEFPILKGVVGGLDLTNPELESQVKELKHFPQFVGVRHILDFEDEAWLTRPDVHQGLQVLQENGLVFDLLLRPHLLKYVPDVVAAFPRLTFVVNHIAKPFIKDNKMEGWKESMERIASHPNVYCKISGLVTEADLENWKTDDFRPYIEHIFGIFGEDRVMFGSDWPVCRLAHAEYNDVTKVAESLTSSWPLPARRKFFRENAIKIYNIDVFAS